MVYSKIFYATKSVVKALGLKGIRSEGWTRQTTRVYEDGTRRHQFELLVLPEKSKN